MCQQVVKGGGCRYYNGVDEYVKWNLDSTDADGNSKKLIAHRNSDGTISTNKRPENNNMTAVNTRQDATDKKSRSRRNRPEDKRYAISKS